MKIGSQVTFTLIHHLTDLENEEDEAQREERVTERKERKGRRERESVSGSLCTEGDRWRPASGPDFSSGGEGSCWKDGGIPKLLHV